MAQKPPKIATSSSSTFINLGQPVLHSKPTPNTTVISVPSKPVVAEDVAPKRPAMKAFNSTDLRMVKLSNKNKSAAAAATKNPPTPKANKNTKANHTVSLKSALKNAIKSKFMRAKGSPTNTASDHSDDDVSDSEWIR